ncbi:MAG: HPr family phosphocarrier protein [Planctomycetes bacterium]|jgi:phosphocarrier protein|nr:HPr family phosphocarrier protein [Planctomycetota bacterium]MBT6453095.1 HPr family phosphocarrier protein [Planctomycetota bacterium]MBT6542103.1 HPr family phosphocarrier protein [Planctomycetota bacterium]MBT6783843.1 HPr family phosphocarrier protein [Planctomycetota bacterium]MBT6967731.1 HPr family phosphocarrier protein [Planctomycetota bacterium]
MSSVSETLKITHSSGLHARASTEFVRLAQRFSAEVSVSRIGGSTVDGKSTIAVMTLGAQLGDDIMIETTGPDAEDALAALTELVRLDFHGV